MAGPDRPRSRERPADAQPRPFFPEAAPRGAAATAGGRPSPAGKDAGPPARKPDEPTSPHHAEHEDPVERAKTAMRKAGERARRVKRSGASGIRGGTSQD